MALPAVTLIKKSAAKQRAAAPGAGGGFILVDNEDDTCTVKGTDAAGAQTDISAVATLTVSSDAPTLCSVDSPVGMTFKMHGLLPGNANITIVATWNDGSVGPFTIVLPVTLTGGPATGITVTPGVPVAR